MSSSSTTITTNNNKSSNAGIGAAPLTFRQRTAFRRRGIDLSLLGVQKHAMEDIKKDADGLPNIDAFWEAFDDENEPGESFIHVIRTPMRSRTFTYDDDDDDDDDNGGDNDDDFPSKKENAKDNANQNTSEPFNFSPLKRKSLLKDEDWSVGFQVINNDSKEMDEEKKNTETFDDIKTTAQQDNMMMIEEKEEESNSIEATPSGIDEEQSYDNNGYYDNDYGDDFIDDPEKVYSAKQAYFTDDVAKDTLVEPAGISAGKKNAKKGRKKRISFVMAENDENDKEDVDAVFQDPTFGAGEEDEEEDKVYEADDQDMDVMMRPSVVSEDEESMQGGKHDDEEDEEDNVVVTTKKKTISSSSKQTGNKTAKKKSPPTSTTTTLANPDEERSMNYSRHGRKIFRPLAFWKNEKVVYEKDFEHGLPTIRDVIINDAESPMIKAKARATKTLHRKGHKEKCNILEIPTLDFETKEEDIKAVAFTKETKELRKAAPEIDLKVQTNFSEGEFMTSGFLVFPPKAEKPSKNSGKYSMVFYVVTGVFEITLHESTFVINTGGQFMIPRGNVYRIKNLGNRECRLFFCHCQGPKA